MRMLLLAFLIPFLIIRRRTAAVLATRASAKFSRSEKTCLAQVGELEPGASALACS